MALRINVGCGQTSTPGWRNFDNSLSLRLSKIPLLPDLLHNVRVLEGSQYQFIQFARENDIEYGDATKGLPFQDESCDVLYSSHMLDRSQNTMIPMTRMPSWKRRICVYLDQDHLHNDYAYC